MKNRQGTTKHKKRYSKISSEKRLKLVKMVIEDGLTLTKVAKLLHIKRPTAKVILKRYKEKGTFFHKKIQQIKTKATIEEEQQLKIEQRSEYSFSIELHSEEHSLSPQSEASNRNSAEQFKVPEQFGFLFYYPSFEYYHGFA